MPQIKKLKSSLRHGPCPGEYGLKLRPLRRSSLKKIRRTKKKTFI